MKVVIIGGIAGGAGAAARLRRLDEKMEIVLVERGAEISYANCGLPYFLGRVIKDRSDLLIMTPEKFRARFNVDTRVRCEAVAIDRTAKSVLLRDLNSGRETVETYDKLILSTGSLPSADPLPGNALPGVFRLWTLEDLDKLDAALAEKPRRVLVAGGGYVGVELVENLRERGCEVTLLQRSTHLLPTLDQEMSNLLVEELRRQGIGVELKAELTGINRSAAGLEAILADGRRLQTEFAVLCVGVKPNSELARAAGLDLGRQGHIITDQELCSSDPDIYAIGDVIEVKDPIFQGQTAIPLAGPANRQARLAADNICGRDRKYRGTLGTSIIKVGSLTAASTGYSERLLKGKIDQYHKVYLHPSSHASYYPGSAPLHIKVIFTPDGTLLGAQIVGRKGVDKRIDVISTAMCQGMKAQDLAALELAYAPPYSSAKDPVNFAGMIAENVLSGLSEVVHFEHLPEGAVLLDAREKDEHELGSVPGAVNIPLSELRSRWAELPQNRRILVFCQSGLRSYIAERILKQQGLQVATVSGGYLTWKMQQQPVLSSAAKALAETPAGPKAPPAAPAAETTATAAAPVRTLDVRALACPGPVVRLKQEMEKLQSGDSLELLAPLSFEPDLESWSKSSGNTVLSSARKEEYFQAVVRKQPAGGEAATAGSEAAPACSGAPARSGAAMVLFSNDLDKAMAALIIACGMAAAGQKVGIFFTFWGLSVLRKNPAPAVRKSLLSRMFGWMLPKGAEKLTLSKMNMGGMGTLMMKQVMARDNVTTLPELLRQARELGVKFVACEMAMGVMGITREELIEIDDVVGVASFVEMARNSNSTLFI
ncbi:MAG: FAD-dependent oxidoreductase [Oligosphaeraceae bacterium]|nr:FAD-dependent oxidoreductase [Oligosphaeraceae bacterium]